MPLILFMMFCSLVFSDKSFCTKQGGTIYQMAIWNGNPGLGKQINGLIPVCFIPDENKVNNYTIPLETLSNTLATLAVLSFSAKIPFIPSNSSDNPAAAYCLQLGGCTAGMVRYGQMSWYIQTGPSQWDGNAFDFCIFPDFSSIGIWTLFYHTAGYANGIKWGFTPSVPSYLQ
eukprot:TRINITY_DN2642_c0_g1_i2.p1 TRINITY_DN2642_c0_g1~~TRINITY_DN2642_c0_g1_i2.p1  ORF type:complete len:186 (-),score=26.83 TRINITY_DN2642_c0_g1_i2:48-566(-)